jgi:hypothetical protein
MRAAQADVHMVEVPLWPVRAALCMTVFPSWLARRPARFRAYLSESLEQPWHNLEGTVATSLTKDYPVNMP